jgi:predicted lipoprotein with Yx(FWY)xxD motif
MQREKMKRNAIALHLSQFGRPSSSPACYATFHCNVEMGRQMKILVCLSVLLAAGAAQAQSYTTTVNREAKTVTTTGNGVTATTKQTSSSSTSATYTTTITRTGGYQPMGAGGYSPMGH